MNQGQAQERPDAEAGAARSSQRVDATEGAAALLPTMQQGGDERVCAEVAKLAGSPPPRSSAADPPAAAGAAAAALCVAVATGDWFPADCDGAEPRGAAAPRLGVEPLPCEAEQPPMMLLAGGERVFAEIAESAGSPTPRPSFAAQLAAAGVVQTAQCAEVATGVLFPAGAA
jgi:hypothetical protein